MEYMLITGLHEKIPYVSEVTLRKYAKILYDKGELDIDRKPGAVCGEKITVKNTEKNVKNLEYAVEEARSRKLNPNEPFDPAFPLFNPVRTYHINDRVTLKQSGRGTEGVGKGTVTGIGNDGTITIKSISGDWTRTVVHGIPD